MRFHQAGRAAALLAALWLAAAPASPAATRLASTMRADYFMVHYDPSDPELARIMAAGARRHLLEISKRLGYHPDAERPFPLYVYPSHLGFIEAGGLRARKFTVGTTAAVNETISVDASGVFAPSDEVLAHEITHAIVFRLLGSRVVGLPLWFNEGLAKYESEEPSEEDDQLLADAAAAGTLIPLASLRSDFPSESTALAYAESASAVRFLLKRHGRSAARTVLQAMAKGKSFDRAMAAAAGVTEERFVSAWHADVSRQFWALKWTRIATGSVWTIMAVLVVIAFLRRRRQKIEAAKRWEQEEFDEAMRRQLGNDWWR
jgi:hypothetical protein